MLDNAAVVQKHDIVCQPPRLANVVRHENDLDAPTLSVKKQPLDSQRRRGIETRSRLVEK